MAAALASSLLGLYFVRIIQAEQRFVWRAVALSFLREECRTGEFPLYSEALMRQAPEGDRAIAQTEWGGFDVEARMAGSPDGPRLRVKGRYLWPFTVEEPLDRGLFRCGP